MNLFIRWTLWLIMASVMLGCVVNCVFFIWCVDRYGKLISTAVTIGSGYTAFDLFKTVRLVPWGSHFK